MAQKKTAKLPIKFRKGFVDNGCSLYVRARASFSTPQRKKSITKHRNNTQHICRNGTLGGWNESIACQPINAMRQRKTKTANHTSSKQAEKRKNTNEDGTGRRKKNGKKRHELSMRNTCSRRPKNNFPAHFLSVRYGAPHRVKHRSGNNNKLIETIICMSIMSAVSSSSLSFSLSISFLLSLTVRPIANS